MRFAWQTILRLGKVNSFTLLSLLRIVDFAGEESACGFLIFDDVALVRQSGQAPSALALCNVAAMGEIGHSEVLLVHKHNNEIKMKQ